MAAELPVGRDLFISYTWVNRAWAEWIAVELERAGYTTVIQAFDFAPGSDFVHEMQVAVLTAARTIAVFSPAYFESAMSESEWRAVFAGDPSGELRRLVPVRVQPFTEAGLLQTRVYIDLVDLDESTARKRLLDGVAVDRPRPTTAVFPGGRAATTASASPSGQFPGAGTAVSNLPARNRNFTGREAMLERLHRQLAAQQVAAVLPMEALSGLGGVGKTELSVEFGHRFASDYDITWWIPAEQNITAVTALVELAAEVGIPECADQNETLSALFRQLRGRDRWLLIYDNAEQPEQIKPLLPAGGNGHVLVTSRWPTWRQVAEELRVGVLDRPETVAFLTQQLGHDHEAELLDELAELLGDLPLALDEAAAYLQQTGETLDGYLTLLRDRFAELFHLAAADGADQDRRRVATVWSVSLDRVHVETPAAEALLSLLAFLAPQVPRTLATAHPEVLPEGLATVVSDRIGYNQALATIGGYSLATTTADNVGLHRLVQAVIQARLTADEQRSWAGTAVKLIQAGFPAQSGDVSSWPVCEVLLPQVIAVTAHAERLRAGQESASWLLDRAGTYLQGRGQYRQGHLMFTRAVALAEAALGPDHPTIGVRRNNLGNVLRDQGDLAGARTQFERALTIGEAALGHDHPTIAVRRNNLGSVLQDQGDLAGARTQFERALTIGEAALGPDHPTIGVRRNNLGSVLQDQGDLAGARTQFERALTIGEAALGPDHPDIGVRRSNLGSVLQDQGDLAGARTQFERALTIGEAALGPDHPDIGVRRSNLGSVLRDQGDLAGARTQFERALTIGEAALGPDHPDIGVWRSNLGSVLRDQGDLAGARTQFERALTIGEAALGPDHPAIGVWRNNLGSVLQDQGDLAGARTQFERALTISEAALGPEHPTTKTIQANRDSLE